MSKNKYCKHLFSEKESVENVHIANDYLAPRDLCHLITNPHYPLIKQTVFYKEKCYCLCYESCVWKMIATIAKDRGEKLMYLCALISYMTVLEQELPYCEYKERMGKRTYINAWRKNHKDMEEKIEEAMKSWKENKNGSNLERD